MSKNSFSLESIWKVVERNRDREREREASDERERKKVFLLSLFTLPLDRATESERAFFLMPSAAITARAGDDFEEHFFTASFHFIHEYFRRH
jgi:hypothetical protein